MSSAAIVTTPVEGQLPGQRDIWMLVLFEAVVFGSYFVVYMLYRSWDPQGFLDAQQHLNQNFGVANTVILLISSWLAARGVQASREGQLPRAQAFLAGTIACGLLFVAFKLLEWWLKIDAGFMLSTNRFFSFYYFLTGIHVVHVLFGFVFLGVAIHQLRSPQQRSQKTIEAGAIFWHMVDFLWVIIFALLYVMR
ncbi:MAG TPA: cytochrome c oxidase subunit 3 [Fontimonas sp.]